LKSLQLAHLRPFEAASDLDGYARDASGGASLSDGITCGLWVVLDSNFLFLK